jgi:HAD superfamily hydrolase (TIGR01493 family)
MAFAVVFDLDGTLVTFHFDVQGTRKAILADLAARGVDTAGLGLTTTTQQILDTAKERMKQAGPGAFGDFHDRVFSILDSFELASVPSIEVLEGVEEVLRALQSRKVRLAVLTNSGRTAATQILAKAGLSGYFEFVLTRNDTEAMKPSPEGLTQAAATLALPPGSVYYVGDSPYDVMAAKKAGVRIVSVATGSYSMERLRSEGPDFAIPSLGGLAAVLGV